MGGMHLSRWGRRGRSFSRSATATGFSTQPRQMGDPSVVNRIRTFFASLRTSLLKSIPWYGEEMSEEEMAELSVMNKIRAFFASLGTGLLKTKKEYLEAIKEMSQEEAKQETEKIMEAYKAMCLGELTSMYWRDSQALLSKLNGVSPTFASVLSEGFAVAQAAMLVGLVAASFPKSSPRAMAMASNGALFAVLFNIAAFHLEIFEFPCYILLLISWIVLSVLFTIYWSLSVQNTEVVVLITKAIYSIICCVLYYVFLIISYPVMMLYKVLWFFPSKFMLPSKKTDGEDFVIV